MAFDSLADFLAMGGHAPYVWVAYACGLLAFLVNWLAPRWKHRQLRERIARQVRREEEEVDCESGA